MSPAVCFAIAPNAKSSKNGYVLTVASDKDVYETDGRDGHWVRFQSPSSEFEAGVTFVENAFAQASDTAHQLANGRENAFEIELPRLPVQVAVKLNLSFPVDRR